MRLANKACLVTGGGAGIGAAARRLFRREGAKVFTVDVAAGDGVDFVADVADPARAHDAVEAALDTLGGLDVLVCNAAMRNYSALAAATPAEWQDVVAVNLFGAANY